MTYEVLIDGQSYRIELARAGAGQWRCMVNGRAFMVDAAAPEPGILSLIVEGRSWEAQLEQPSGGNIADGFASSAQIVLRGRRYQAEVRDPRALRSRRARTAAGEGARKLTAPMPGKVVRILAAVNTPVRAGEGVLVIEAMKMQNEVKSPKDGVVKRVLAAAGATVNAGDVLAIVE